MTVYVVFLLFVALLVIGEFLDRNPELKQRVIEAFDRLAISTKQRLHTIIGFISRQRRHRQ